MSIRDEARQEVEAWRAAGDYASGDPEAQYDFVQGYLTAKRERPDREPSDAEVLAALNARELSVRERNGSTRHFTPAPDLTHYSDGNIADMRAALLAALEVWGAVADGYTRIEMDLVAVRDEDVKAVEAAFIEIRDRYSRGGSSFGTSRTSDQAFIREEVRNG